MNEICAGDLETRALLVGAGNDLTFVVQAIVPNLVWPTVDFLHAQKGFTYSIVLQVLCVSDFVSSNDDADWPSFGRR